MQREHHEYKNSSFRYGEMTMKMKMWRGQTMMVVVVVAAAAAAVHIIKYHKKIVTFK